MENPIHRTIIARRQSAKIARAKCLVKTRQRPTFSLLGLVFLIAVNSQAMALNKIQQENALPGHSSWYEFYALGSDPTDNPHDIEGYADKDSVSAGETINFYINVNARRDPTYALTIYRLGWYDGKGGRKMLAIEPRPSKTQLLPSPDPITGLVQANWDEPYALTIPSTWLSGIYIVTIIGKATGEGQYIPFVVKELNRSSDYLFQVSTLTWQAYNAWGGKSLYSFNSTQKSPARKVSFNRPYDNDGGLAALRQWDINLLYFLEKEGYDVTYQSDTDTHQQDKGGLLNHKAILSVGHDEYWSKAMRDNFENAQKYGISLGFFGANMAYWQVRLEDNNRTIVGYKDFADIEDPLALDNDASNNTLITGRWRDPRFANRPENEMIGVMYAFGPKGDHYLDTDMVTAQTDPLHPKPANAIPPAPTHWVYTGTSIPIGTRFSGLLGYEADRVFDNGKSPQGLDILASSPVSFQVTDHNEALPELFNAQEPVSHMTVYSKACTLEPCKNKVSTVFASGSLQWVWGLDTGFKIPPRTEIPAVQQITRNVLARMISEPLPFEQPNH